MSKAKTQKKPLVETDDLAPIEAKLEALQEEVAALGLTVLTPDDRKHSPGKLRDGEEKALLAIVASIDLRAPIFSSLAARDHGADDTKVETAPTRAALARIARLQPLVKAAKAIATMLSDELLAQGELVRDVTSPAYGILKVNVDADAKLKETAKPATSFYTRTRAPKAPKKPAQ